MFVGRGYYSRGMTPSTPILRISASESRAIVELKSKPRVFWRRTANTDR